jgi:hypothetical protein
MASGDELRDSVAELLTSRYGEVEIEREFGGKRVDIYFVESRTTGRRRIAVECKDYKDTLGVDALERILASYDRLLRNAAFDEYWIVTRQPLSPKAFELIRSDPNVHAITFEALQRNIFDVGNYVRALKDEFHQSELGKYYIESTNEGGESVPSQIEAWLESDTTSPLAVLAGYGMGKSSLAKFMAYQHAKSWLTDQTKRIPILIELAEFSRQQRLEGVISSLMAADYNIPGFHFHTFMQLNRAGRFFVILDGFDEMKHCMTIDEFTYNWRQICRLVVGRSKVVLFGRPSVFMSDDELTLFLHGTLKTDATSLTLPDSPNFATQELSFFSRAEVSKFIPRYVAMLSKKLAATHNTPPLSEDKMQARIAQIGSLDYDELLKRPIHVKLVCDVAFGNPTVDLTTFGKYELYDQVVRRLCSREDEKIGRSSAGIERRVSFSRGLAWWAWTESKHAGFTASELPSELIQRFSNDHRSLGDGSRRELLASAAVDTKRGLRYHFPHRSILEFLVADYAIREMNFEKDAARLSETLNEEIALFIGAHRTSDFADSWLEALNTFGGRLSIKFISLMLSVLERTAKLKDHPGGSSPWRRKMGLISAVINENPTAVAEELQAVTRTFAELDSASRFRSYEVMKSAVDGEVASFIHCAIILYGLTQTKSDINRLLLQWILITILQFTEIDDFLHLIRRGIHYNAPPASRIFTMLFGHQIRLVRISKYEGVMVNANLTGIAEMAAGYGEKAGLISDLGPVHELVQVPLHALLEALPKGIVAKYREFQDRIEKFG